MHIGYILFGVLEAEGRKQITVIGHLANFANRLVEKIAGKDEIIVSDELQNIVKKRFRVRCYRCKVLSIVLLDN